MASQYQQIMISPKFEICFYLNLSKILYNASQDDIDRLKIPGIPGSFNTTVIKKQWVMLYNRFKDNAEKTQPCPLHQDFLKFRNFSSLDKHEFEYFLPSGDYKYQHRFLNDQDENVFEFKVYETFKTGKRPLQ